MQFIKRPNDVALSIKSALVKSLLVKSLVGLLLIGLSACGNNSSSKDVQANAQNQPTTSKTTASIPAQNRPPISGDYAQIAQNLSDNFAKSGINATIENIMPTAMPDMYMVMLANMSPIFTDKTGTYIIQGEIVQLGDTQPINITNQLQATIAKRELEAVDKSEMIVFAAKGATQAVIYVFTDPTCHYCQLLHNEIEQTTAKGIEVRYLAWPRSQQVVPMVESIWCSSDRQTTLTQAKNGQTPPPKSCDNPVQKHMALGFRLGVSGTPAVFSQTGEQIGGYLPSDELAAAAIAAAKRQ